MYHRSISIRLAVKDFAGAFSSGGWITGTSGSESWSIPEESRDYVNCLKEFTHKSGLDFLNGVFAVKNGRKSAVFLVFEFLQEFKAEKEAKTPLNLQKLLILTVQNAKFPRSNPYPVQF